MTDNHNNDGIYQVHADFTTLLGFEQLANAGGTMKIATEMAREKANDDQLVQGLIMHMTKAGYEFLGTTEKDASPKQHAAHDAAGLSVGFACMCTAMGLSTAVISALLDRTAEIAGAYADQKKELDT